MQETWVQSVGQEKPLGEKIATHSSILVWKMPWTEEPAGLQSMGPQRVGHDWVIKHTSTRFIECFCCGMQGTKYLTLQTESCPPPYEMIF